MSPNGYQLRMPAPLLGQHNDEIFVAGLGCDRAQLSLMRQLDII